MGSDNRRELLRVTDNLLEGIEQLRLQGFIKAPEPVQAQVADVAARIGQRGMANSTLANAHVTVFRLQESLLPGAHQGRTGDTESESLERVQLGVQRAHDRVRLFDAQLEAAQDLTGEAAGEILAQHRARAEEAQRNLKNVSDYARRATGQEVVANPPPIMPAKGKLKVADLVVDLDTDAVLQGGRPVWSSERERAILAVLIANRGRAVTLEAMQYLVCQNNLLLPLTSRAVGVNVANIRRRLDYPEYLHSVDGMGYRIASVSDRRRAERKAGGRRSAAAPPTPVPSPSSTIVRRLVR